MSINNAYTNLSMMIWGVTWAKKIFARNETATAICNGIFASDNCDNKTESKAVCLEKKALAIEVSIDHP